MACMAWHGVRARPHLRVQVDARPKCHCAGSCALQGNTQYTAPEVRALGKVSYASDVYAFGVLCVELCTGQLMAHPAGIGPPRATNALTEPANPSDPPGRASVALGGMIAEDPHAAASCLPQPLNAMALACMHPLLDARPAMHEVAAALLRLLACLDAAMGPGCAAAPPPPRAPPPSAPA